MTEPPSLPPISRSSLVAAVLLLAGGVLGAVGLGVDWAEADVDVGFATFSFQYGAFGVSAGGSSQSYDEADGDGTGRMRSGGPLLAIGMALAFLALVASALDLFVPERHLDWVALGGTAAALLLHVLGMVLLASGIDANASRFGSDARTWVGGFYVALVAAVLLGAGLVALAWPRLRRRQTPDD